MTSARSLLWQSLEEHFRAVNIPAAVRGVEGGSMSWSFERASIFNVSGAEPTSRNDDVERVVA
jgi:hypothetical protein